MLNLGLSSSDKKKYIVNCFLLIFLLIMLYPVNAFCQTEITNQKITADNCMEHMPAKNAVLAETPVPGDIIFTQAGAADPDRIEFVTLKRLNLTGLHITDNAVKSDGTLGNTEGTINLDETRFASLGDVPQGTFIRFESGTGTDETDFSDRIITYYFQKGPMLATAGDQVIIYSGESTAPVFIAGVDFSNDGWIISGETTSNTSYAPNTISDIFLGTQDNYRFKGRINDGRDATRNFIKTVSNWEGSNSVMEFTVKDIGYTLLPVVLTSFSARIFEGKVLLKWTTASEVNNYGWDIERKSGSTDWYKVGFIAGHGNSNIPKIYSFIDHSIQSGETFFYRLNQIDNDGITNKYSEELKVIIPGSAGFSMAQNYPNPFNNSTVISYTITEEAVVSLKVFNILGKEIASFIDQQQQQPGSYNFRLDLSAMNDMKTLSSGIYLYRLQAGNNTLMRKFIIMK